MRSTALGICYAQVKPADRPGWKWRSWIPRPWLTILRALHWRPPSVRVILSIVPRPSHQQKTLSSFRAHDRQSFRCYDDQISERLPTSPVPTPR
ncbi:hypothetical protein AFLA_000876 [Aspergillus flavus NRRL3357]|nr:hypothetical protein AFLA_000876 [Aspergillus flavus NRRL3357]